MQFPEFKPLELTDYHIFQKILQEYDPYSDFNFVSLWSYDTVSDTMVSLSDTSIMLRFRDYLTDEPFYTLLVRDQVAQHIELLYSLSELEKLEPVLKLVPECVIRSDPTLGEKYHIEEDRDNHDYILSVEHIMNLTGNDYGKKRNMIHRFAEDNKGYRVEVISLAERQVQRDILDLLQTWQSLKQLTPEETNHEFTAINRLLDAVECFTCIGVGMYLDGKLCAFSISEVVQRKYGMIHFEKADYRYRGIYEVLKQETAKVLYLEGCVYINYEQDLGLPGLRNSKTLWNPVSMMKKYTIRKR